MDNEEEVLIRQLHMLSLVSSESTKNVNHANKLVVLNTVTSQLTMFMEDKNMMGILGVERLHTLK